MRCVQRRACPRPLNLNLLPPPTPLINYDSAEQPDCVGVTMTVNECTASQQWYFAAIESLDSSAVSVDRSTGTATYDSCIKSDESHVKPVGPEELVHATTIALLCSKAYSYPVGAIGHEIHFPHGSKGSNADEADIIVYDSDDLEFALLELKSHSEFDREKYDAIQYQLFGTASLIGAPKLLVYATVQPKGTKPSLDAICIDYTKYKTFEAWRDAGEPHSNHFPQEYRDLDYKPLANQEDNPLDVTATLADFRAIALAFHSEFFGEHPDNTIFVNLIKCLLAKIYDERTRRIGEEYHFQVFHKAGRPETAEEVFERVNTLYKQAYRRYIAPNEAVPGEINIMEFSKERVKTVVQALQQLSITTGAVRNGDVIGTFFEEILRAGFKQDRGMYFTHDNLARFMVEAVGIENLTQETWKSSDHPENRLPYIIDPACGSGTFLRHCMQSVTDTVANSKNVLVSDHESEEFFKARLHHERPNYWAEQFIYGFDPKFIMAITARVNMVLHGDGSTHILKEDAFSPFARYSDVRLRPINDGERSVPRARYRPDMCETFDLVVSNPPFSVTLSPETRAKTGETFTLPKSTSSEGLFVERCFQLLKPGGRLAVVVPESLLNGKETVNVRLFIYRMFKIKAIVSLPRNLFIDTPTKTSILFAQKKLPREIEAWDKNWDAATQRVAQCVANARRVLTKRYCNEHTANEVARAFAKALRPVLLQPFWVLKRGSDPALIRTSVDWTCKESTEASTYYRSILQMTYFKRLCEQSVLKSVATQLTYDFPVYEVDEVGFKLSKRGERSRPNHLFRMRGKATNQYISNLHLAEEECDLVIDTQKPQTVLDEMIAGVSWS